MKESIKNLNKSEIFDLGYNFRRAVVNSITCSGLQEREFARCLTAYTGNKKLDEILMFIARKINLGQNGPIEFARSEIYKLLS